jgi:hypothetical protein
MSFTLDLGSQAELERIKREIADSFDEELEMELDETRLDTILDDMSDHPGREQIERRVYFRELFRLQHELVRLQDWSFIELKPSTIPQPLSPALCRGSIDAAAGREGATSERRVNGPSGQAPGKQEREVA